MSTKKTEISKNGYSVVVETHSNGTHTATPKGTNNGLSYPDSRTHDEVVGEVKKQVIGAAPGEYSKPVTVRDITNQQL